MSGASPAPYVALDNTGFAQQSEEKEETPPEQQEDQAFEDAQQGQTDFDRDAGPTAGAVPINQDLQLLLRSFKAPIDLGPKALMSGNFGILVTIFRTSTLGS